MLTATDQRSRLLPVVALVLLVLFAGTGAAAQDRPNVIVIFTDDQGHADLGVHNQVDDVLTPNIDSLAENGALFTNGYITAPQCSPSRGGMLTGRYQQRYDFDSISDCPLPLEETTFASRLQEAGYATGMVGKWHLSPNVVSRKWAEEHHPELVEGPGRIQPPPIRLRRPYMPDRRGFDQIFHMHGHHGQYFANFGLEGQRFDTPRMIEETGYRIDIQTDAALTFIQNHAQEPFFLYLPYYAPHVPLEAIDKDLELFPDTETTRRQYGLAMIHAMDRGIGRILETLQEHGIEENTLIFYLSDHGAPLAIDMPDDPIGIGGPTWTGSLNEPWLGEKGMLSEGGIRVPFVVQWKGRYPGGQRRDEPVTALDIAPTVLAAAGLEEPIDKPLDGDDMTPLLSGEALLQERPLFWRFWNQAAVREGDWKYLRLSTGHRLLFDLASEEHENANLIEQHPEVANRLNRLLENWMSELEPAGLPPRPVNNQELRWYRHYFGLDFAR